MTIKLRDAAGVLKSATTFKIRDAASVLKSISTIKIRDAANVLKTAFSTAGGGGHGSESVTIAPAVYQSSSASAHTNTSDFTATFSNPASSIVWSITGVSAGATAQILSGQGTATARVQLTTTTGFGFCTIRCTAIISGDTEFDTASKQHTFTG